MPDATDQDILLPDGAPNWPAIEFDLLCSRCDYNLRTLTKPRCPECGMDFNWNEALDRAARHSGFLFEHAWLYRPIRSWFATWWACLRPESFWHRVSIHDPVHAGPLLVFIVTNVLFAIVLFVASTQAVAAIVSIPIKWAQYSLNAPQPYLVRTHYQLDRLAAHPRWPLTNWLISIDYRFWIVPIGFTLCVIGLFVVLSTLHQTLARFRIRRVQLLRVVTYATPPMCAWSCVLLIVFACTLPFSTFGGPIPFLPAIQFHHRWPQPIINAGFLADLEPLEIFAYFALLVAGYLIVAFPIVVPVRDYLRVTRPWRLAFIVAFTGGLLPASILAVLSLTITGNW